MAFPSICRCIFIQHFLQNVSQFSVVYRLLQVLGHRENIGLLLNLGLPNLCCCRFPIQKVGGESNLWLMDSCCSNSIEAIKCQGRRRLRVGIIIQLQTFHSICKFTEEHGKIGLNSNLVYYTMYLIFDVDMAVKASTQ